MAQYGLGLAVDGGFADVAAQRADNAQQKAEAIDASMRPSDMANVALGSITGGLGGAAAPLATQAKDTLALAGIEQKMKDAGFIDQVIREATDNNFITQNEAMAYSQLARSQPEKALEALSTTSNVRRADLAATEYVNKNVAPKLSDRMKAIAQAKAEMQAVNPENEKAAAAAQAKLQAETEALVTMAQEMLAGVDSQMSQMLPEAREKAKAKIKEYLSTIPEARQGNAYVELGRQQLDYKQYADSRKRVDDSMKMVANQLNKYESQVKGIRSTLTNFNPYVQQANAADAKTRAMALHPATMFAVLTGDAALRATTMDGKPIPEDARSLAMGLLGTVNNYAKDISGAQVTVPEAARIFGALGISVPPELGSDAGKPTTWAAFNTHLANGFSQMLRNGNWKHDQVARAINEMLQITARRVAATQLNRKGILSNQLLEAHEAAVREFRTKFPKDKNYIDPLEGGTLSLMGIPTEALQINIPDEVPMDVRISGGLEAVLKGVKAGAFGNTEAAPALNGNGYQVPQIDKLPRR